jgi:hypothetical protein
LTKNNLKRVLTYVHPLNILAIVKDNLGKYGRQGLERRIA